MIKNNLTIEGFFVFLDYLNSRSISFDFVILNFIWVAFCLTSFFIVKNQKEKDVKDKLKNL